MLHAKERNLTPTSHITGKFTQNELKSLNGRPGTTRLYKEDRQNTLDIRIHTYF